MEAQFDVRAQGPDGQAYEVVFNATSMAVALEALMFIAANAEELLARAGEELLNEDEPVEAD